ncbi:hypothetical protein [Mesobacillus subterraneus]|uniref:Aminoglycoside phosphotransferase domain-containing protein n=1 Tax=Mesobacillus subterraneus TaxID=285983 RepID=A0A427TWZ0_9BACI|nr:hypothetical protein [Mesobacillus subterraneus]RSD28983.1 hypothetical protein EJA10_02405 [Mesobacillus subterraneus]
MVQKNEIMKILTEKSLLENNGLEFKAMKGGTTNGLLYTLFLENNPAYVVKIDRPSIISATEDFLLAYQDIPLLPNVIYTAVNKEYIVYSYIAGETHFNRCSKLEWMAQITEGLFNRYKKVDQEIPWGRIIGTERISWAEFNRISLESAKESIGDILPSEDHRRVGMTVDSLKKYHDKEEKYYLHGDTGVHNFVYSANELKGVIDPSPLIGPKIYDFTYAFCSSPDGLDISTLMNSFSLWKGSTSISRERLMHEVVFQLYTRIGVCNKVHPHDLNEYMEAWEMWREYLE